MQDFRITQIGQRAYSILDAGEASFYLVEGETIAAVIDTGITQDGAILPTLRTLTQKPLVLVVTHAHIDHMYHMDEFETVYLCHQELEIDRQLLVAMQGGKQLKLKETIDIHTGSVIDLGGESLEICQVGGHSPGSVVVWAKQHNLLFTGDAIGSGYGVWLQTPGALPLSEYYNNLLGLMCWLVERGGRMRFHGGHSMQQFCSSSIVGYNPLGMGLLADLIDLVDKVVSGEIVGRDSNADKVFELEPTRYASYGRAELQYKQSNIHAR